MTLSWRLSDLWACFSRPPTIFGRVRIVEVRPHYCKGTPALAGYLGANTPYVHREDTDFSVGISLKSGWLLGRFPKPCGRRGVDFGRDRRAWECGCFPRSRLIGVVFIDPNPISVTYGLSVYLMTFDIG